MGKLNGLSHRGQELVLALPDIVAFYPAEHFAHHFHICFPGSRPRRQEGLIAKDDAVLVVDGLNQVRMLGNSIVRPHLAEGSTDAGTDLLNSSGNDAVRAVAPMFFRRIQAQSRHTTRDEESDQRERKKDR
jgi:hypothetical protein